MKRSRPRPSLRGGRRPTKQSLRLVSILLCVSLSLSGCATQKYRIKCGDELRVVIWKEMDEKAVVRPDHKISLPLVGEVSCKGKTAETLSQDLTQKFETQTTVMVTKSYTYMDFFKDVVTVVRDAGIIYFLGQQVGDNMK